MWRGHSCPRELRVPASSIGTFTSPVTMKWIHLTAQARTAEDFALLTKLLDTLGLRSKEQERHGPFKLQTFFPDGLILEVVHRQNRRECADVSLTVSDPDSAVEIIKGLGLELQDDSTGPEPKNTVRSFRVTLPGGTRLEFTGFRTTVAEHAHEVQGRLSGNGKNFGIVVSRFNSFITERLLSGAIDGLLRCGVKGKDIEIVRVPGSFEIPAAARTLALTGKYDAIICLGCLLRGETAHYEVIANEVTRGIGQSAQETGIPHAFGVLTCDTLEQAIDRAGLKSGNKGFDAALAAVEMAGLKQVIRSQESGVGKRRRGQGVGDRKGLRSQVSGLRKTHRKKQH